MLALLRRPDVRAWCLYDFANSAFITSVTVVLLPIYWAKSGLFPDPEAVRIGGWTTNSQSLWAYANSLYMVILALTAPVLGAIADSARGKKRFLAVCVFVGGAAASSLALPGPGGWAVLLPLYVLAAYLWGAGNIFYDAFLPEFTKVPREMDAVSAAGYGVGYLGGGLLLFGHLVLVNVVDGTLGVRIAFASVGAWWILFTLPLLLRVKEHGGRPLGGGRYVREGFRRLRRTLGKIRRLPQLAKFLLAFLLYNSGVGTLMIVAASFAAAPRPEGLGLETKTIVSCLLMIQFAGLPAAFGYIWLAGRIGARNSIYVGIIVYLAVVVYAWRMDSAAEFWVLGGAIALVQGGVQAMSRSLYGTMLPEGMAAEFYGFFSVFNKVGGFIGPLVFGLAREFSESSRIGILFLAVLFAAGFAVLALVRPIRGAEEARAFAAAGP